MSHTLFTGTRMVKWFTKRQSFVNLQTKAREYMTSHAQGRTKFALILGELVKTITLDNG